MKTSNYILMLGIMCFLMVLSSCEPLFVPTVEEGKTGTTNGYEWVDLGLPSGVKWATCNMGASSPQESGKTYAWEMFNVRSSWGDKWRMPKMEEFEELVEHCKIVPTMFMGMKGVDCKGPNGNHIFIPFPDGGWSRYWTISLNYDGSYASTIAFNEAGASIGGSRELNTTLYIRPILNEAGTFSVSYNANGGSGYMKSQMFYDGIEQMLQANAFTREGFVLMGWNTKADGSGTSYKNGEVISISQNVTLYAQWKGEPVVVTFDANGGSGSMEPQVFESGVSQAINTNLFTRYSYVFNGWNTKADGSGQSYVDGETIVTDKPLILYAQWKRDASFGEENGYEWVDLGLPSGLKWATCNVGAYAPENYGTYYAWGETQPRSNYSWSYYKHCNGSSSKLTKYNTSSDYGTVDNKTTLELSDDAAHVNWGGTWRMPTYNEWDELKNNCTWKWTTQNGVNGYKVTSKTNGYSIFLPAAGYRNGASVYNVGSYGYYWSSSLDESGPYYACGLFFNSGSVGWYYGNRYGGHAVRAVCP